jgi:hypothetical protein
MGKKAGGGMINARPHSAPEAQGRRQANPVFLYRQLSSASRCGHPRERDGLEAIANQARKEPTRVSQGLTGSQCDNLDRYDANGCARVTVDQSLANLAAFTNGVVLSRSSVTGIETAGSAIGKRDQDAVCLRHCKSGGDQGVRGYGHQTVSFVDQPNIGPMALYSQEVFSE